MSDTSSIPTNSRLLLTLKGHANFVNSIAYSPDGKRIVSGSLDGTIRIWDTSTGLEVMDPLKGHQSVVHSVSYSPDGRSILSASADTTLRVWNATSGNPIGEPFRGHQNIAYSAAYSRDGKYIVSGSRDKTIRIWSVDTHKEVLRPLEGHTDDVNLVTYSPDGRSILSGSDDKTIRVWDAQTGDLTVGPIRHVNFVWTAAYSPDGKLIASLCSNNDVYLWNSESGLPVKEPLKGHSDIVRCISFSLGGKYLVSGSDDRTIRFWEVDTGNEAIPSVQGHTAAVNAVAYSPNGRFIISGSSDETVRVWDAQVPSQEYNDSWFLEQEASKTPVLDRSEIKNADQASCSDESLADVDGFYDGNLDSADFRQFPGEMTPPLISQDIKGQSSLDSGKIVHANNHSAIKDISSERQPQDKPSSNAQRSRTESKDGPLLTGLNETEGIMSGYGSPARQHYTVYNALVIQDSVATIDSEPTRSSCWGSFCGLRC